MSVFLPQTLICTVEDGILVLLLQVLPVVGISGGCRPPLRVSFSGRAARAFSELPRVRPC